MGPMGAVTKGFQFLRRLHQPRQESNRAFLLTTRPANRMFSLTASRGLDFRTRRRVQSSVDSSSAVDRRPDDRTLRLTPAGLAT